MSQSPEWTLIECDDQLAQIYWPGGRSPSLPIDKAQRIVAAVNACKHATTEELLRHDLPEPFQRGDIVVHAFIPNSPQMYVNSCSWQDSHGTPITRYWYVNVSYFLKNGELRTGSFQPSELVKATHDGST